jgi:hypothetical protein
MALLHLKTAGSLRAARSFAWQKPSIGRDSAVVSGKEWNPWPGINAARPIVAVRCDSYASTNWLAMGDEIEARLRKGPEPFDGCQDVPAYD